MRETFRIPKVGTIAGCRVSDGIIKRDSEVRLLRDNVVVFKGKVGSLRRFKDDASEVRNGMECGISIAELRRHQGGRRDRGVRHRTGCRRSDGVSQSLVIGRRSLAPWFLALLSPYSDIQTLKADVPYVLPTTNSQRPTAE